MKENFTSLVFFTVLSQAAAGTLIFRELIFLRYGNDLISAKFRLQSLVIVLSILLVSLAFAFFHLGYPLHALHAVNNIATSWLSREIFTLSGLIALLLLNLLITIRANMPKAEKLIALISVLTCLLFLFSMIKLYMVPTILSWYNPYTPVSFVITTLICGIIIIDIIPGDTKPDIFVLSAPLIFVLIFFSLLNSILYRGTFSNQGMNLFIFRFVLSISSLVTAILIFFRRKPNKTSVWMVILFITVVLSELISRYIFFLSFERSGL
jgi:anaerobic dimethyl sulfoxide reductase subunit C (anchor subunit)